MQMKLGVFGMPASGAEGRYSVARVRRMAVRAVVPAGCVCVSFIRTTMKVQLDTKIAIQI